MNDLQKFKKKFDPYLKEFIKKKIDIHTKYTTDPAILDSLNYTKKITLSGGKRVRPYLAFLTYVAFGGKNLDKALKYIVAIELLHMFCLVHDDIMDNGKLRHGIPTINIQFGKSHAILLGDLFFSWANEIINTNLFFNENNLKKVKEYFYKMIEEVILGQMIDIDTSARNSVTKELIDQKIILKTASYSCIRPMQIGAALTGKMTYDLEKLLNTIGTHLGIAFQTQDDLLDITSTDIKMQKTTSSDKSQNQHTYFTYFKSPKKGKEIIKKNFVKAKEAIKKFKIENSYKQKFINLITTIENRTS